MDNIKLGDLYLSKSELDDIVQLVAKKRQNTEVLLIIFVI